MITRSQPTARRPARPATARATVRIIGGEWNGRKIHLPANTQLRPSTDRVREALLSCLHPHLPGSHCLDLYAGSGALAFCAASRGAHRITLVEKNRRTAAALKSTADHLGITPTRISIHTCTAERFLTTAAPAAPYNIAFLDPPYSSHQTDTHWANLLTALHPRLSADAHIYCESHRHITPPTGWQIQTQRRTGSVHWQILRPPTSTTAA